MRILGVVSLIAASVLLGAGVMWWVLTKGLSEWETTTRQCGPELGKVREELIDARRLSEKVTKELRVCKKRIELIQAIEDDLARRKSQSEKTLKLPSNADTREQLP